MRTRSNPILVILVTVLFLMLWAPAQAEQPPITHISWAVGDFGAPVWGDSAATYRTFEEPMHEIEHYTWGTGVVAPLDPSNNYLAFTGLYDRVYPAFHMWAELWMANTQNPVTAQTVKAEIWYGGYTGPVQKIAEDTVVVDNVGAPQRYMFDFGTRTWYLTLQAAWLVIDYQGDAGDTVIYWDSVDTPTCLHLQGTLAVKESTWGSVKELFR